MFTDEDLGFLDEDPGASEDDAGIDEHGRWWLVHPGIFRLGPDGWGSQAPQCLHSASFTPPLSARKPPNH